MAIMLTASYGYEIPVTIDPIHSAMIFSNNDGGSKGIFYRLIEYYKLRIKEDIRYYDESGRTVNMEALEAMWKERITVAETAMRKAKRVRFTLINKEG